MKEHDSLREHLAFTSITSINVACQSNVCPFPQHWHEYMEIVAPFHDGYQIKVNSQLFTLGKEDILIVFPGEIHEIVSSGNYQPLVLQFRYSLLTEMKEFKDRLPLFSGVRLISTSNNQEVAKKLLDIIKDMRIIKLSNPHFLELKLCARLYDFFSVLGDNLMNGEPPVSSGRGETHCIHSEKLVNICSYLNENCIDSPTLEEVAEIAGFSKFYFSRIFKDYTGYSFSEYVNRQKIRRSEMLLTSPENNVTEVAFKCGFGNISTFNRAFRTLKGCTPREFRAMFIDETT